jgi:hypothetical protein
MPNTPQISADLGAVSAQHFRLQKWLVLLMLRWPKTRGFLHTRKKGSPGQGK